MHVENRLATRLAVIAILLAFIVVMLGAYTRLKDAGLGCPDWPGCYGHLVAPVTAAGAQKLAVTTAFSTTYDMGKAWKEMVHRYVAGTLGALILVIAFLVIRKRKLPHQPVGLALGLIALLIFQALLGKWTVTLQLFPTVVMSHLLGGMFLLSLLWLLVMRLGHFFKIKSDAYSAVKTTRNIQTLKPWAMLGLIVVATQIFLGGWTSANYAALICPDFPFCQGKIIPPLDFHAAFRAWSLIGPNFEGGILDNIARVTIQMLHRFGAFITFIYLICLSLWIITASKAQSLRKIAGFILGFLFAQTLLGIINVVWLLPLPIAVAHNGVAALLLLSVVTLNYAIYALTRNPSFTTSHYSITTALAGK